MNSDVEPHGAKFVLAASSALAASVGLGFLFRWLYDVTNALLGFRLEPPLVGADLNMFLHAGRLAGDGSWDTMYDPVEFSEFVGTAPGGATYAYTPPLAQIMNVFSSVELQTAIIGYLALSTIVLLLGVPVLLGARSLIVIAVFAFPLLAMLRLGQTTPVAVLVCAIAVRLAISGRPFLTGAILGLLAYKLPLAAGPAVMGANATRSRFGAGVFSSVILTSLVSFRSDPGAWQAYVGGVLESSTAGTDTAFDLSLASALEQVLPPRAALVGFAMAAATVAGVTWVHLRKAGFDERIVAISIMVSVLSSPRMLIYDWVLLIVPALVFADALGTPRRSMAAGIVVLAPFTGLTALRFLADTGIGWLALAYLTVSLAARLPERPDFPSRRSRLPRVRPGNDVNHPPHLQPG